MLCVAFRGCTSAWWRNVSFFLLVFCAVVVVVAVVVACPCRSTLTLLGCCVAAVSFSPSEHSSTSVRKRLKRGKRCEHITFPSVVRLLKRERLLEAKPDTEEGVVVVVSLLSSSVLFSL